MRKVCTWVTLVLLRYKIIAFNEIDIYQYGIYILLTRCLYTGVMLLIGIIMSSLYEAIIFIAAYSILRRYAGGYHSNSMRNCLMTSCIVMIVAMLLIRLLYSIEVRPILWIVFMLLAIAISILAPIDSPNKPVTNKEIVVYAKKTRITVSLLTLVSIILWILKVKYYKIVIAAFVILLIMMLIGIIHSPRYRKSKIEM